MDRFQICLPYVLAQECRAPNDWSSGRNYTVDDGGPTMCGITQREYDIWRKSQSLPVRAVRQITQDEGELIYRQSYWLPDCPSLCVGLDLQFFDASVNEGPHEAVKILQVSLGVPADGEWGAHTALAVRLAAKDAAKVIAAFTERRKAVYRETKDYNLYGGDWERRADEMSATALKMAAEPPVDAPAPVSITSKIEKLFEKGI